MADFYPEEGKIAAILLVFRAKVARIRRQYFPLFHLLNQGRQNALTIC